MSIDRETQLRTIRNGLDLLPEELEIDNLVPLFVPASFFAAGNWPGPYERLRAREIGLTWSVLLPNQTMRYVDHAVAQYWAEKGIDWKGVSVSNLAKLSGETLATHDFRRATGEVYAVAMMHSDGVGPSRLLLRDQLASVFSQGYRVALPEMSSAFALSENLDDDEISRLQELIEECYQNGTRPLAVGVYDPDDLLPDQAPR